MVVVSNPGHKQQPHHSPATALGGGGLSCNVWGHRPIAASLVNLGQVIVPLGASVSPLVKRKRKKEYSGARIFPSLKSSVEWMPKDEIRARGCRDKGGEGNRPLHLAPLYSPPGSDSREA